MYKQPNVKYKKENSAAKFISVSEHNLNNKNCSKLKYIYIYSKGIRAEKANEIETTVKSNLKTGLDKIKLIFQHKMSVNPRVWWNSKQRRRKQLKEVK